MTEDEARARVAALVDVSRETEKALDRFVTLLRDEATRQNLISASTLDHIWARHILDSVQLLRWDRGGPWLDLGSGAGFPGLVVAALRSGPVTLVESRRLRAGFLERAIEEMGLGRSARVEATRLELLPSAPYDIISARAFAPLDRLLPLAHRLSHKGTVWLLPKGRGARVEVDAALRSWQGAFGVEPSVTDPESGVIVARNIQPRRRRGA